MNTKFSVIHKESMQGAVAVELALLLIPLIVMTFGVAEFGRAIYEYNTLTKTVRDAARYLSQHDPDGPNYATVEEEAKCLAVHGTEDCTGSPLLMNLSTSMVQVSSTTAPGSSFNLVKVAVTGYSFNFYFNPLVFFGNTDTGIPFGEIQATMRQL